MIPIARLQAYLRESARQRYEAVAVPPFTLFFHPAEAAPHFNYAIPDEPAGGDLRAPLAELRQAFTGRSRQPRFEFIADFAPDLAPALQAAGFVEESRAILMICTPETYRPAPEVPGLTVTILDENTSLTDVGAVMAVQHEGFSMTPRAPVSDEEAADFLKWLAGTTFFLARLAGEPVSAGSLIAPLDGLAEVAGIATLSAYRRRGIAAVITDYALRTAFARGVEIALLTAGDEPAGRVYERVGFRRVGMALAYGEPTI
jgi:GNAT superfamily N-acetyltransferase